jgi:hypothetical protein
MTWARISRGCAGKETKMPPADKHGSTNKPTSDPTTHLNNGDELEQNGEMASPEPQPKFRALGKYVSEENMEHLSREARGLAKQGKALAEKFVREDLRDLSVRAEVARRGAKAQLESQIKRIEPKAEQLGTKIGGQFKRARKEVEDLGDATKGRWEKVKLFVRSHRLAILVGLIALIFVVSGHPEYILYTLLHLVMIFFATAHTIIGLLSLIFDSLFEIELFSSMGYALYNVTYAFYFEAFYITDSIMIWLKWIHIFT